MLRISFIGLAFLALTCDPATVLVDKGSGPLITLEVRNFTPLPAEQGHYEAWISFSKGLPAKRSGTRHADSSYVSLGRFNLDPYGNLITPDGKPFAPHLAESGNPQYMADAIITIESEGDSDDIPGPAFVGGILTGDIRTAHAELTTGDDGALGSDFVTAEGFFLLGAPTSTDSADSASGIWFMKSVAPQSAGLLRLPPLGAGWRYEGWARECCIGPPGHAGYVAFSTGTFRAASGFDADSAGSRKGLSGIGYAYPGQDFVGIKRLTLNNGRFEALVTIEPNPDNSTEPFALLTLFQPTHISPAVPPGQSQLMPNNSHSFPTARIEIIR